MELLIPYLPSLAWYRAFTSFRLGKACEAPRLPKHFCRAEIVAPFGRRCLSVPVEGGRRMITPRRYPLLALSEHGNWRHTHWSTIASAYGASPYFHLYEAEFEDVFSRPHASLIGLCSELHTVIDHAASLSDNIEWLLQHPDAPIHRRRVVDADESLSVIHLLFEEGPATLFSLLPEEN